MYLVVGFHHWLRPSELSWLDWRDVSLIYDEAAVFGVVRIRNPKVSKPTVQHVLMELPVVQRAVMEILQTL